MGSISSELRYRLDDVYRRHYTTTSSTKDQVPEREVLTYISCMDSAYVREPPPPRKPHKVQDSSILGT